MFYDTTRMARLQIDASHRAAELERLLRPREPVRPTTPVRVDPAGPTLADAPTVDTRTALALSERSVPAGVTAALVGDCGECRDEQAA